jgi:hypothetical protein
VVHDFGDSAYEPAADAKLADAPAALIRQSA